MNLRDLKYIIEVARYKNFSQAAEACFISQPTLSAQIKKLEELLDIQIFERTNKQVMVTEAGQQIIDRAKLILQEVESIHAIAESAKNPESGQLRLGAFPTLSPYLFPGLVPRIKETFPKLQLILTEEKTNVLIQQLKEGQLDAAFLALPVEDDKLEVSHLFKDEFYVLIPEGHPLSSQHSISEEALLNHDLLLLDEGHCLRDQALDLCQRYRIESREDVRATSMETLRQMVKAGTGITLIPNIAVREEPGLVHLPFKGHSPFREIALVWRKTTTKRLLLDKLVNLSKSI